MEESRIGPNACRSLRIAFYIGVLCAFGFIFLTILVGGFVGPILGFREWLTGSNLVGAVALLVVSAVLIIRILARLWHGLRESPDRKSSEQPPIN